MTRDWIALLAAKPGSTTIRHRDSGDSDVVLWMTKDAFWAAVLGIVAIALFVGYNTSRSLKRRYKIVKRDDSESSSKWN